MKNQKIMLELFSGSKSISNFFESKGFHSVSVDNNHRLCPSICKNILDLKPVDLPGQIDFIWASPDCTYFSRASESSNWFKFHVKKRIYDYYPLTENARTALSLLQQTIQIINYYPGVPFVIENPIGRIQHLKPLKSIGHNRYYVNYYDFGFSYSKETYLFTNLILPFSTKKITVNAPGLRTIRSKYNRSKVPELLIDEIYKYIPGLSF